MHLIISNSIWILLEQKIQEVDDRLSAYKRLKNIGHLKGDLNRVTQDIVDLINEKFEENYTVESLKEIFQENNEFIANSISNSGEFSLMVRTSFS